MIQLILLFQILTLLSEVNRFSYKLSVRMNSNKQLTTDKTLYLKQFFANYFDRKQHIETISALTNGLTVIDALIAQFEKENSHHYRTSASITYGQKDQKNIHQMLEDIYNRLSHIFEKIREQNEGQSLFGSRKQPSFQNSIQDDELYEILNKYKNDFKREKEGRIRLQKEIVNLKQASQTLRTEKQRAIEKARNCEKLAERLKNQNSQLETKIDNLIQQIEALQQYKLQSESKLQESLQIELSYANLNKDYELLLLKYEESQQQQILLKQKFTHLDQIVQSKIKQNQAKWTKTIEQKLSNNETYTKPACKAFREFIKSFNKENLQTNS